MLEENGVEASLRALTLEAQSAIHGHQLVLTRFPFRVGRESRGPNAGWSRRKNDERRGKEAPPTNELYLWEQEDRLHVSREHFQIEQENDDFFLVDRGSALGTWVEGQLVGGNRKGGRTRLHSGDVIIVGSHRSGFIFKFVF